MVILYNLKLIKINSGIFQGDSPSLLLFCLSLTSLSKELNIQKRSINHLFYMDDLKLLAKDDTIFRWNKNPVFMTNPFIYCNVLSAAAPIFKKINFFCKSTKKYRFINVKTLTKNNKIQLIMVLSNHIIPCQIRIMERNWCFCLILVYQV